MCIFKRNSWIECKKYFCQAFVYKILPLPNVCSFLIISYCILRILNAGYWNIKENLLNFKNHFSSFSPFSSVNPWAGIYLTKNKNRNFLPPFLPTSMPINIIVPAWVFMKLSPSHSTRKSSTKKTKPYPPQRNIKTHHHSITPSSAYRRQTMVVQIHQHHQSPPILRHHLYRIIVLCMHPNV